MSSVSLSVLGPLTTTFTPPPTCTQLHVVPAYPNTGYEADWGRGCTVEGGLNNCYPSLWASFNYKYGCCGSAHPVYSPAAACPSGWGAACSLEKKEGDEPPEATDANGSASLTFWNSMEFGQTAVGCCPGGFTCGDFGAVSYCKSDFTPGDILTLPTWDSVCNEATATITVPANQDTGLVSAYRINVIVPASTQILPAPTPTATSKKTAASIPPSVPDGPIIPLPTTSTASSSNNGGSGSDPAQNTSGGGSGLSQSGVIAVAVTVPVCVIALAVAAGFILFRRRKAKEQEQEQEHHDQDQPGGQRYEKSELDASKDVTVTPAPRSAAVANLTEMDSLQTRTELPVLGDGMERPHPAHELGSTWVMPNEIGDSRSTDVHELSGRIENVHELSGMSANIPELSGDSPR